MLARYTVGIVAVREASSVSRVSPALAVYFVATLGVLGYATWLALMVAPVEATMGDIYRVFYYHVPANILAEIFPYVNLVASLAYLFYRQRNPERAMAADAVALAAAEVTLVFGTFGLVSGMLWARPVWGIWWTWDARLTTALLLWLLYVSYLMVRRFSSSGQMYTVAAVLSIFAAIDVPIVFMSIRWWRTQHPAPVLGGDGSLDKTMYPALLWNFLGWAMWGVLLTIVRYKLERRRQQNQQDAVMAVMDTDAYSHVGGD